jgi:hypothetical protein
MTQLSRRDFLKLAGTAFAGLLTPEQLLSLKLAGKEAAPDLDGKILPGFSG